MNIADSIPYKRLQSILSHKLDILISFCDDEDEVEEVRQMVCGILGEIIERRKL